MKEEEVRTLVEAIEDPAEEAEKDKKPREPPIVFRELIAQEEYSRLKCSLGTGSNGCSPEDQQALNELNDYIVKDEGAWALSDETIHYIGKLLHDKSLNPKIRANLLRCLAAAALKDDIILMLHQDRKEHLLMNYAVDIEHLPKEEQEGLALFICNLFESTSSSEWLLYISEWAYDRQTLSNARVTTKVAVNALLSPHEGIRDKGTAIMHNLAAKEKLARNRVIRKVLPKGAKSQVFDDIATELSMAILQFLTSDQQEEFVYRALKSLLRFCHISYNEVPALIKMIGPHPDKFRGMSERVDDLVNAIAEKLDGARYRQPTVPLATPAGGEGGGEATGV